MNENYYELVNANQILNVSRMGPHRSPFDKENNLFGLYDFIKHHDTKDKVIVEIGCYLGISTELFAMFCKEITSIDLWGMDESYDGGENPKEFWPIVERLANERLSKYSNAKLVKNSGFLASQTFESESIDLLYLDGNHSFESVVNDAKLWHEKIKVGGVLSGHDYNISTVQKAVNYILDTMEYSDLNIFGDTSWSLIKK